MFCCMPELEAVGSGSSSREESTAWCYADLHRPCGGPWRLPTWWPETDTDTVQCHQGDQAAKILSQLIRCNGFIPHLVVGL